MRDPGSGIGIRDADRDERSVYYQQILDELAGHGLIPRPDTPPQLLRDAVRDLYKYEIRASGTD